MNKIPTPNVLDRSEGFARIQFINDEDILGYRIRVANSLDNAYGPFNGVGGVGTTALFDVLRGQSFISKTIRQRGTGILGETARGQTRAVFDPNEFFGLSPEVPSDDNLWFLRIQVSTVATAAIAGSVQTGFPGGAFPGTANASDQSKILIMRDPGFNSVPRPAISLSGTAPNLAGATPGLPAPPEALVFGVPAFADAIVITNHSATDPLFFAVATDQPLMQVNPNSSLSHASGMKDDLVFCAAAGNPTFSLLISTVTGLR